MQGPAQTNAFSSLSSDHNMAHRHWTDKETDRDGEEEGEADYNSALDTT